MNDIMSMGKAKKGRAHEMLVKIPNSKTEVVAPLRYLRGVTVEENKKSGGVPPRMWRNNRVG
nr:hypothetical protein 4 [bacterium]